MSFQNSIKAIPSLCCFFRVIWKPATERFRMVPFRESLPEGRQKLFALLKTMERSGGCPYIPRLQLRTFIDLLEQDQADMSA